jgi:hypothetical protein
MYLRECGLFLAACGATDLRNGFVATVGPSKVSKISESASPAKIPHRSDVGHEDEEVL